MSHYSRKRECVHVDARHHDLRRRLLDLLMLHPVVKLRGRPDREAWSTLQQLIQDELISLRNSRCWTLSIVRGQHFAEQVRRAAS
jgi:hypothetical protein